MMKYLSIWSAAVLALSFLQSPAAENYAFLYPSILKSGKNLLKSDLQNWHGKSIKGCSLERGNGSPFSSSDPTLLIKSAVSKPNYWAHTEKLQGGRTFLAGAWVKNDNAKILFWFWGNYGKPVRRLNDRIYYFAGSSTQLKNYLSPESKALLGGDPEKWHLCYRLVKTPAMDKPFNLNMMIGAYFATGNITIAAPFIIDVTDVKKSGMTAEINGKKPISRITVINLYNRDEIWSKKLDQPETSFKTEIPDTDFRHGLDDKSVFKGFLMQVQYTDGSFDSFTSPEEKSYKHQW